MQAADNLPLYGVCCYMDEMVHRPPAILSELWPQCSTPLSRYLVAAPRCYCFLTHFPFFTLHMKVRIELHLLSAGVASGQLARKSADMLYKHLLAACTACFIQILSHYGSKITAHARLDVLQSLHMLHAA